MDWLVFSFLFSLLLVGVGLAWFSMRKSWMWIKRRRAGRPSLPEPVSELKERLNEPSEKFNEEGYRSQDHGFLVHVNPKVVHRDQNPEVIGTIGAKYRGDFNELVKEVPALESQVFEIVKECHACGMIQEAAADQPTCVNCGADIKDIQEERRPNLHMGYIFGVEKLDRRRTLKVSLRAETKTMIVFDSPEVFARAHLVVMPTDTYIPDVRTLFINPGKSLEILKEMDDLAWKALSGSLLKSSTWRKGAMSKSAAQLPVDGLRSHVMRSFQFPPIRRQLYMNYVLPPLLPCEWSRFNQNQQHIRYQHFPYTFVLLALRTLATDGLSLPDAPNMTGKQLIDRLASHGVDYDVAYRTNTEHLRKSNSFLANFRPKDFSYCVVGDAVCKKDTWKILDDQFSEDLLASDKLVFQELGRPYVRGKPGGRYYSHARAPRPLKVLEQREEGVGPSASIATLQTLDLASVALDEEDPLDDEEAPAQFAAQAVAPLESVPEDASQDAAAQQSPPQEAPPQEAPPRESAQEASPQTPLLEASQLEVPPQEASQQQAPPQGASQQEAPPQEASQQQAPPQGASQQEAAPQEAPHQPASTQEALPQAATPQQVLPAEVPPMMVPPQTAVRVQASPQEPDAPQPLVSQMNPQASLLTQASGENIAPAR